MKKINLTQGLVTLVDDEDYEYINQWKWFAVLNNKNYYACRNGKSGKFWMHREIIKTPDDLICDHIDHNGLNNQKSNLRNVNKSQNAMNSRLNSNNKLREKCIRRHGAGFQVRIVSVASNIYFCKTYRDFNEAILARDNAIKELCGEFGYIP